MAVTKPLFINQVEYDAESERRGFAGLVAQSAPGVARTGVLGPAPAVSLSGSTVQVGPFNAAIGSAKGVYLTGVDSVTPATGTVAPADATNGRLDRVVLEVLDPDNGSAGTTRTGRLRVVPGTAAAIPVLPAMPPLSLHVAQVQMPKSGAGNPTIIIDPPFTAASGAPVPVRSDADLAGVLKVEGSEVVRLDRGGAKFACVGGQWVERVRFDAGQGDRGLIVKAGNVFVNTNASGDGYYTFPTPFPNALVSCVVTDATLPSAWQPLVVKYASAYSNTTRFGARIFDARTGAALTNLTGLQLTYIAVGH